MNTLEIARKFAALGETNEACKAYKLALNECQNKEPATEFECALNILQFGRGEDYKISYTCLRDLYNQGFAQDDILAIMDEAFYQPNVKRLQKRYEKNCKLLSKYPYIFRKDFLPFVELPIIFFPYDDNQYTPYDVKEQHFGEYVNFQHPVISRNFFKDLAKPILAADVFSQYELEYLNDNVRKSEWVARENHIYLHYTSWPVFCAYLQCLDLQALLKDKKIVFLIEDEIEQYPIDFKERFGIDYSKNEVKPIGVREINRLIWHTQLSAHNGGDFFNEIFDAHPNLLVVQSVMFDTIEDAINRYRRILKESSSIEIAQKRLQRQDASIVAKLWSLRDASDKDFFVGLCLSDRKRFSPFLKDDSRIVPTIFFQPHFHIIDYVLRTTEKGQTFLYSEEYERIVQSTLFQNFKYIKTFTPMRRFTTSHAATVKFSFERHKMSDSTREGRVMPDLVFNKVLNRSFMIDWQDRLFKDCRLVRFEDGKLNPKATFTALAAFLDLPYTESLTYCSESGELNPETLPGNDIGFDPAAIYRKYDDYANDSERTFIEYFLRDAYEYYGYDFQYYNGSLVDVEKVNKWLNEFDVIDYYMYITRIENFNDEAFDILSKKQKETNYPGEITQKMREDLAKQLLEKHMQEHRELRLENTKILMRGLHFVNKNGQPLHMMPLLKLDPELLEQPLYR